MERTLVVSSNVVTMSSSLDDDWTVVSGNDKKRVMRRTRGRRGRSRPTTASLHKNVNSSISSSVLEDKKQMQDALSGCMDCLRSTQFYKNTLHTWSSLSDHIQCDDEQKKNVPRQIVCYGLGNFSHTSLTHYSASLWQLSCLLCLREFLLTKTSAVTILFYDPCTTSFEERFLADDNINVHVLTINDQGKRAVDASTVFFMPHCPSRLYENVLWANWEQMLSSPNAPMVFFGNSFRNHCEGLNKVDCPCMRELLPWFDEEQLQYSKVDCKESPGNFIGAFNDTYLTYFRHDETKAWPSRPYDSLEQDDKDQELL